MINWILCFTRLGYLKIFYLHHLPTALIQAKGRPEYPEQNKSQVKTGKLGRSDSQNLTKWTSPGNTTTCLVTDGGSARFGSRMELVCDPGSGWY